MGGYPQRASWKYSVGRCFCSRLKDFQLYRNEKQSALLDRHGEISFQSKKSQIQTKIRRHVGVGNRTRLSSGECLEVVEGL